MTFGELIEHAQQCARGRILSQIQLQKEEGFELYAEPAARDRNGELVFGPDGKIMMAPDGLKLPLRYDLVIKKADGKISQENAESKTLAFREPVVATWGPQLKIEVRSFSWDDMELELEPAPEDWEGIRQWFLRWFDVEEKRVVDADGLLGVVHFITDPIVSQGRAGLFVDLGSASTDVLADLFDELVKQGVSRCVIGKQAEPETFVVKN